MSSFPKCLEGKIFSIQSFQSGTGFATCKGSARSRKFFPRKESRQNSCVLREEAKSIHPQDDYKEAAELAFYLLGGPETKIWKTCGANHHARWKSNLLHAPKMFIFKKDLLNSGVVKLKIFLTFSSFLYDKAWLEATKGSDVPVNDIQLYKNLGALGQISSFSVAAHKAHEVLNWHSWHLTEVSVFSLFSNKFSAYEKLKLR